mmetsp:Transcript_5508/g.6778  ORF Transcript_5508/g.6778 Transcript_5508/m.6778 type:complete len:187 (-) Transcript_5508:517-1077(-)
MATHHIVVLGCTGVGKSALTIQYVQSHFVKEYDPTMEESFWKQTLVDEKRCVLNILDTAEEEEYSAMRARYMRPGEGFIMTYSITDRRSFDKLAEFYQQILVVKETTSIACVLVGNKCDLAIDRQVCAQEAQELAEYYNKCPFFETSAKDRINVDEVYKECTRLITKKIHNRQVGGHKKNKNCSLM